MAKIGYARVSTTDQHPEVQTQRLEAAGCESIFIDKGASGAKASRPEWDKCLAHLRPGDALVCIHLDRIGRSVRNLVDIASDLEKRKIDLVVLDQAIDTTTPSGKLMFHIMAAVAEFERSLIVERTRNGLAATKKRGRRGGRAARFTPGQAEMIRHWRSQGWTINRIREEFSRDGVLPSHTSIYRVLVPDDEEAGATVEAQTLSGRGGARPGSGAPKRLTQSQVDMIKHWHSQGWSVGAVEDELAASGTKVSRATIYRAMGMTSDNAYQEAQAQ